jgi:hypothetical protein
LFATDDLKEPNELVSRRSILGQERFPMSSPITFNVSRSSSLPAPALPAPASVGGSTAATTSANVSAAQLAKATDSQLQKLVRAGNQAAIREAARRAKVKLAAANAPKPSEESAGESDGDEAQEAGKGKLVNKTA